jgi:glycosyltransferase involved in cell wall biosynthesis
VEEKIINPKISCVCVTHKKPHLLKRAIKCFQEQTYQNKQLVIVYEEQDKETHKYIQENKFEENIKIIKISSLSDKKNLGELRNISIQESDGEYIIQWDDDDWYHKDRLIKQLTFLTENKTAGVVLANWIMYDHYDEKAYLGHNNLWEGTIMCKKDILLKVPYLDLDKGEDTFVITELNNKNHLSVIQDEPYLYIYTYHGDNTWDRDHFVSMFKDSTELSPEISEAVKNMLSEKITQEEYSQICIYVGKSN